MHEHFHDWGPGAYPQGALPPLLQVLVFGLANLFWIALFGTLLWTALQPQRWANRRTLADANAIPSALELLRNSYIYGQIDVETFADMLVPVLALEEFGHADPRPQLPRA